MSEITQWSKADQKTVRHSIGEMDLCSCGSSTDNDIVLMLLERAENHDVKGSFYDAAGDASKRWVEFGAKCLDSWGLIEHGTGIGWAWLSDEGKLLLRFLREFGTEGWDGNKPEEGGSNFWPRWSVDFSDED